MSIGVVPITSAQVRLGLGGGLPSSCDVRISSGQPKVGSQIPEWYEHERNETLYGKAKRYGTSCVVRSTTSRVVKRPLISPDEPVDGGSRRPFR